MESTRATGSKGRESHHLFLDMETHRKEAERQGWGRGRKNVYDKGIFLPGVPDESYHGIRKREVINIKTGNFPFYTCQIIFIILRCYHIKASLKSSKLVVKSMFCFIHNTDKYGVSADD